MELAVLPVRFAFTLVGGHSVASGEGYYGGCWGLGVEIFELDGEGVYREMG